MSNTENNSSTRPLDNLEEKRHSGETPEKQTKGDNRAPGGLNDGNPNTDSTPASSEDHSRTGAEGSERSPA